MHFDAQRVRTLVFQTADATQSSGEFRFTLRGRDASGRRERAHVLVRAALVPSILPLLFLERLLRALTCAVADRAPPRADENVLEVAL